MAAVGSLCAVVLALAFAWSGVAKLRSPMATARSFEQLGLIGAGVLARVVPFVELGLAVALLLVPSWGAVAAVALLAAFTAVLIPVIRSGREVSCGCFGSTSKAVVSPADVVRNLSLIAAGLAATAADQLAAPSLPSVIVVSASALVAAVVVQLVKLRNDAGSVFGIELAGEVGR